MAGVGGGDGSGWAKEIPYPPGEQPAAPGSGSGSGGGSRMAGGGGVGSDEGGAVGCLPSRAWRCRVTWHQARKSRSCASQRRISCESLLQREIALETLCRAFQRTFFSCVTRDGSLRRAWARSFRALAERACISRAFSLVKGGASIAAQLTRVWGGWRKRKKAPRVGRGLGVRKKGCYFLQVQWGGRDGNH